jgi:hypothetical protein
MSDTRKGGRLTSNHIQQFCLTLDYFSHWPEQTLFIDSIPATMGQQCGPRQHSPFERYLSVLPVMVGEFFKGALLDDMMRLDDSICETHLISQTLQGCHTVCVTGRESD